VNPRERAVLIFLTATFLAGAGITLVRRHVRARQAAASPIVVEGTVEAGPPSDRPVDLNQARRYELEALPGIGPVLAGRILDYRARHDGFREVGELRSIPGIGPKRYSALVELVSVGPVVPDSVPAADSGPAGP